MANFVRQPRVLPVIGDPSQLHQYLNSWRSKLNQTLRSTPPPPPPFNLTATGVRGAIQLTWAAINVGTVGKGQLGQDSGGPDGYEILKSLSGTFGSDVVTIPLRNINQTSYTDSVGGNVTTCSYRIHTTAGTQSQPHSITGPDSGVVKATSIDSNDTVTTPVTTRDNYLTDSIRATARYGRYRTGI